VEFDGGSLAGYASSDWASGPYTACYNNAATGNTDNIAQTVAGSVTLSTTSPNIFTAVSTNATPSADWAWAGNSRPAIPAATRAAAVVVTFTGTATGTNIKGGFTNQANCNSFTSTTVIAAGTNPTATFDMSSASTYPAGEYILCVQDSACGRTSCDFAQQFTTDGNPVVLKLYEAGSATFVSSTSFHASDLTTVPLASSTSTTWLTTGTVKSDYKYDVLLALNTANSDLPTTFDQVAFTHASTCDQAQWALQSNVTSWTGSGTTASPYKVVATVDVHASTASSYNLCYRQHDRIQATMQTAAATKITVSANHKAAGVVKVYGLTTAEVTTPVISAFEATLASTVSAALPSVTISANQVTARLTTSNTASTTITADRMRGRSLGTSSDSVNIEFEVSMTPAQSASSTATADMATITTSIAGIENSNTFITSWKTNMNNAGVSTTALTNLRCDVLELNNYSGSSSGTVVDTSAATNIVANPFAVFIAAIVAMLLQ